jgi:tetratricopeptide (TPR) repeat protein
MVSGANLAQSLNLEGLQFVQSGFFDKAIASFEQAVTLDPDFAEAHYNLGVAYTDTQQPEKAIAAWQKAVAIKPDYVDAWWNLGALFRQQHQIAAAIACYQEILEYQFDTEAVYVQLGELFAIAKDLASAIECYEMAIELNPENLESYFRLAWNLYQLGETEAAQTCYQKVIEISPTTISYTMLGDFLLERDKIEAGLEQYQIALQVEPESVAVLTAYSMILISVGKLDLAKAYCEDVIKLAPDLAAAYENYATLLLTSGSFRAAKPYFDQALERSQGSPLLLFRIALLTLLLGDYENGFVGYEHRWEAKKAISRSFQQPWWDGSDLTNQTILVWAEQAYGDAIQFGRYLSLVVQKGGTVIFQCPNPLMRLLGTIDQRIQILAGDAPVPDFDVHIPLMSLPRIFKTTLDSVPNQVPYLAKNLTELAAWESLHETTNSNYPVFSQTNLNIGIVWASGYFGDRFHEREMPLRKSCPVSLFLQLLQLPEEFPHLPNIHLYSMQVGRNASDIKDAHQPNLHDLTPFIHDFSDSAVFVSKLDLVISVDTALAHLAGAMGKPVWILLPLNPDWRWLTEREDSPWYPTARLFRQKYLGDWDETFVRVKQALVASSAK